MISLLRKALDHRPFHPVTLVLENGHEVTIRPGDFAAVLGQAGLLYVEAPAEARFLDLHSVKAVRTPAFSAGPGPGRDGGAGGDVPWTDAGTARRLASEVA